MSTRFTTGVLLLAAALPAQEQKTKTLRQQLRDPAADFWIYDDVERGYTEAKLSGKPLLVSFRCVP